jgi:hypothetical protein
MTCSAPTLRERGSDCIKFKVNPKQWAIPAGGCSNISTQDTAFDVTAGELQVNGATCDPSSFENVPPPAWQTSVRSCESAGGEGCGVGGSCVPELDEPLCIWIPGDTDCPVGPYEVQVVFHETIADGRGCTECSCAGPTGTCAGSVSLAYNSCQVGIGSIDVGKCGSFNTSPAQAGYLMEIDDPGCAPEGGDPTGQAVAEDPVTFCCTQ